MQQPAPAAEAPADSEVPWGIASAIGSFVLAFAIYISGVSVLFGVNHVSLQHHDLVWDLGAYQILVAAVILCVLLFIAAPYHAGLRSLGYRDSGARIVLLAAVALVVTFAGIAALQWAFDTFFPSFHLQGNAVQELGKNHHYSLAKKLLVLAWAAIEAPLTEETLFRGIVYQGLRHLFRRVIPLDLAIFFAALVSGALFGLAHGEPQSAPILIFMGVVLAYVFEYGKSIYASALVHGVINAISVIYILG
ncbi:MAG TPA: CPBP family intramembrane glutamic endopeptidase [Chloroflexota bacterium]|nr:CPBP family intramembrane glutamic endopeptidase [Chloroflexota bacterium]